MCLCVSVCSVKDGLDLVKEAINRTGYNERIKIAIDVSATDFCIGDIFFAENPINYIGRIRIFIFCLFR